MLWLVNRGIIQPREDFSFEAGGCFLNETGRQRFLESWIHRMGQGQETEPFWRCLTQQVRSFCEWLRSPQHFCCYRIQ